MLSHNIIFGNAGEFKFTNSRETYKRPQASIKKTLGGSCTSVVDEIEKNLHYLKIIVSGLLAVGNRINDYAPDLQSDPPASYTFREIHVKAAIFSFQDHKHIP